jgi:hypothetical protein
MINIGVSMFPTIKINKEKEKKADEAMREIIKNSSGTF